MSVSLQADPALQQGYILVDGQKIVTLSPAGGLSATKVNLPNNSVTTEKIVNSAVTNDKLSLAANAGEIKKALNADNDPPIFACRAWVNFDGTKDTTGAASTANTNRLIRASGNVASVLRNGLGDYTITYTSEMPDADYSVAGMSDLFGGSGGGRLIVQTQTAASVRIRNHVISATAQSGGFGDSSNAAIQIFR
jgi:hypothetical protein